MAELKQAIQSIGREFFLLDGAISERVKRHPNVPVMNELGTPGLLYSAKGREILSQIYESYFEVARITSLPLITIAPTWRADKKRLSLLGPEFADANLEAVKFLTELRRPYLTKIPILVAGDVGCMGDAYKPEEALTEEAAVEYHDFQIGKLSQAGIDLIFCLTLPSVSEAIGMAKACDRHATPYLVSFVIGATGALLDGTPLDTAIRKVDESVRTPPLGYIVNCVHVSSLELALPALSPKSRSRFLGIKANPSARTPEELENLNFTDAGVPTDFGFTISNLVEQFALSLAGGCCGTDERHILELGTQVKKRRIPSLT